MQYQKFKNLISGPIIFQSGETFVPDYSCEKAIKLTVDILNLKNNKNRKLLKDAHEYDGFNFSSIIISELCWRLSFNFIKYRKLINQKDNKYYIDNNNKNSDLHFILRHIYDDKIFKYSLMLIITLLLKKILKKFPLIYNLYLRIKEKKLFFFQNKLDNETIIFDILHKNNFRVKDILNALNKSNLKYITTPGKFQKEFFIEKNFYNNKYEIDENKYDELTQIFILKSIKRIEEIISSAQFRYDHYKKILKTSSIKYFLSMDEVNYHVFPLLLASKKVGIKTIGYQHGAGYQKKMLHYSHLGIDNFKMDWFDTLIVWGEYWKKKVILNKNLKNINIIIGANKLKNHDYKIINNNKLTEQDNILNFLIPFEFITNTMHNGKYINLLLKEGHNIYFKARPDDKIENQLECYNIKKEFIDKVVIVHEVDEQLLNKIHAIFGNMTSFLWELYPNKIPILFPESDYNLFEDIVSDGLAIKITLKDIPVIKQIIKNYEYKGNSFDYYFSKKNINDVIRKLLS